MLFHKNKINVDVVKDIDVSSYYWCSSAKLVLVSGTGALETETMMEADDYYGHRFLSHIKLNGVPLVQKDSPSCPTCASMLATGYGINTVDCPEIRNIREKLNMSYVNLEHSIMDMAPLLGLLQSGLYVIADIEAYPTDGNGHFFWEVNDSFTDNPATAGILTEDYDYVNGIPAYLYPTQNTECFDENRVDYYIKKYEDYENAPRTIVYNYSEFVSLILDGHHKACAAAKLGKKVKCIAILPYSGIMYEREENINVPSTVLYSGIKIDYDNIQKKFQLKYMNRDTKTQYTKVNRLKTSLINRIWERCYHDSTKYYLEINELAEMVLWGANIIDFSDKEIELLFSKIDDEKLKTLRSLLLILSSNTDHRTKDIAFKCAKIDCYNLKATAFKVLNKIKDDPKIEEFFIDYIVEDNDKHSLLRMIASSYWD
ncbi:hypothetical protein psyc5s11_49730 [Clostridium gelidum]|uniref:ParB-like nuclease domain protein n=1 Tax=Clostridium gelidum TaxID=704125 RepID=A0ABN6J3M5_9CLOT|nr:hypothetical protein [Clostridium gelidum]BCZ48906.1 hypothetical protein psyc5s11_49730 [Clostridium gelidum]